MLTISNFLPVWEPNGPTYFTITGTDPGSTTLGVADIHVDIQTMEIAGFEYRTFNANKSHNGMGVESWMEEYHGARANRLEELMWRYGHHLDFMRPLFIACETAYFSIKTPSAIIPLIECIKMMEMVNYTHNPYRPFYRIETGVAKKSIAPTNKETLQEYQALCKSKVLDKSKEKVRWCAERHPEFSKLILGKDIDEHSLDAAVVAYAQLLRIRDNDFTVRF